MRFILNGKIEKIYNINDKVCKLELLVKDKEYNKETKKNEFVDKIMPVTCFGYVKNKINKNYLIGEYIDLVVKASPKEYNGKHYVDVIAESLVVSFEKKQTNLHLKNAVENARDDDEDLPF